MRKLASIRKIDSITPIEGADKIVRATVGGWNLVTAIDNGFKEGDFVLYFEIDSWIPTELAPFLSKGKEPREFNGIKGERLRTIKLRGVTSQGLIMPIPDNVVGTVGEDLTEFLGIQKWEKPIPAQLAGIQRGNFPSFIPKTDQERIQNLKEELDFWRSSGFTWEVTEKLEGSLMTVYLTDLDVLGGYFGVCSRNMDLLKDENNTFWKVAIRDGIEEKMRGTIRNMNVAIQGELIGPGVQGNIYGLSEPKFMVFDVYDISAGGYFPPEARRQFCEILGLTHAPVLETHAKLYDCNMESLIKSADGRSVLGSLPKREGKVYKCNELDPSFKVISNDYLIGEKD